MGYIRDNIAIRDITNLRAFWFTLDQPLRSLTLFSFGLNYHFHQLDVFGYHLTNLIIHVFNALLAGLIVKSLCRLNDDKFSDKTDYISVFVTFLFLAHPIQTQAVSYMTQRFASLSTLFYLCSFACYIYGRTTAKKEVKRLLIALAVLSAIAAMFSKQIAITLPVMIILFEILFMLKKEGRPDRKSLIFILCAALFVLLIPAFYSFRAADILQSSAFSDSHQGDLLTTGTYFLTQSRVLMTYLRILFFPVYQTFDYDFTVSNSLWEINTLACSLVLMFVFYLGFYFRQRDKLLAFGIFWFFITLSVESSVITIKHVIFEHRVYLPFLGFAICISQVFNHLLNSQKRYLTAMLVVVISLVFLTNQRNRVWQNELVFWRDNVRKSPEKARTYVFLGQAYEREDRQIEALNAYDKAIELRPQNIYFYNQRADYFYRQKQYYQALEDVNWVLERDKENIKARLKRANAYGRLGEYKKSIEEYDAIVAMERERIQSLMNLENSQIQFTQIYLSQMVEVFLNRGNAHELSGRFDLALKDYDQAAAISDGFAQVYLSRGKLLVRLNRSEEALRDFDRYIQLNPQDFLGYFNRANQYFQLNDLENALKDYLLVEKIKPDYAVVYNNIGTVYAAKGEFGSSIEAFSKSIILNPHEADNYYRRSRVYFANGDYIEALKDVVKARKLGLRIDEDYVRDLTTRIKNKR